MNRFLLGLLLLLTQALAIDRYVDVRRTGYGSNTGGDWANAWTNFASINWGAMGGGDTLWISGGTYNENLNIAGSGASAGSRLTVSTSSENGHDDQVLIHGSLSVSGSSSYVTVNGAKNKAYLPTDNPFFMWTMTNNINLKVDLQNVLGSGIYLGSASDIKVFWVESCNAGTFGNGFNINVDSKTKNIEAAYLYIHDILGFGFDMESGSTNANSVEVHHSVIEMTHDNWVQVGTGGLNYHHNLQRLGQASPEVGHPDGYQGSINRCKYYCNVSEDPNGWPMATAMEPTLQDVFVYNNCFYFTTKQLGDRDQAGPMINSWIWGVPTGAPATLTNIWWCNNTYICNDFKFKVSDSYAYFTDIIYKNFHIYNNCFGGVGGVAGSYAFQCQKKTTNPSDSDLAIDYNVIWGVQHLVNLNGSDYNDIVTWQGGHAFKSNSIATPTFVNTNTWNYSLSPSDTACLHQGTNLSAIFTTDITGRPRPAATAWSIGAFEGSYPETQFQTNLVLHFTFDPGSWTNSGIVPDLSGYGNNGLRYSTTNWPTATTGHDGLGALWRTPDSGYPPPGGTYTIGDWIAVTNQSGFSPYMTNATLAVWAWFGTNSYGNSRLLDCGYADNLTTNSWALGRNYDANVTFRIFKMGDDGGGTTKINYPADFHPGAFWTTNWHHYAVAWSAVSNLVVGYWDGVPCMTNDLSGLPWLRVPPLTGYPNVHWIGVGVWPHDGTPELDGDFLPNAGWMTGPMDEVRIYNSMLSSNDIYNLYAGAAVQDQGPGSGFTGTAVYMSPSGDDGNIGTQASPVRTGGAAQAIAVANSVTNIILADGSYSAILATNSNMKWTAAHWAPIPPVYATAGVTNAPANGISTDTGVTGVIFDGLFSTGAAVEGFKSNGTNVHFLNCWAYSNLANGILSQWSYTVVSNCVLEYNGTTSDHHGIYFSGSNCTVVANTVRFHTHSWGIQDYAVDAGTGNSLNCLIANNVVVSNYSGIVVYGNTGQTNFVINNTIVHTNAGSGMRTGYGIVVATNNIIDSMATRMDLNNGGSYQRDYNLSSSALEYTGAHDVVGNPLFSGIPGDFHLNSYSPAIDHGASVSQFITTDRGGNQRPTQAATDIGAYEYQPQPLAKAHVRVVTKAGRVLSAAFPPDTNTFPLALSAGKHYLVDNQGNPFFLLGDAAWSLEVQLNAADRETYLANRQAKGFNAVLVECMEKLHSDHPPTNAYGQIPFSGTVSGEADFTTPVEAYWTNIDAMVTAAYNHNICVFLAPAYLGYAGDGTDGWYPAVVANGSTKLTTYGTWLGNRYKGYRNIVWMHGGDYDAANRSLIDALANGIITAGDTHIHTAETHRTESTLDWYTGSYIHLNGTYPSFYLYTQTLTDYNRSGPVPCFMIEGYYELAPHPTLGGNITPLDIRRQAYWGWCSGNIGGIYGHTNVWDFYSGWNTVLDSQGATTLSYLKALSGQRPWYNCVPDSGHTTVTAGYGANETYVTTMRESTGKTVIAYLPTSTTITVDMTKVSGANAKAWWFNPRDGSATTPGTYATSGTRNFTSPDANDWVLVLDDTAQGYGTP